MKKYTLEVRRKTIADKKFDEATKEILDIPEECDVEGSERWETDGDKLLKKFYYTNYIDNAGNSLVGVFVVEFKPNSATVVDVHSNT